MLKTCRQACEISKEHTVWLDMYRYLCSFLPPPRLSCPPESLASLELERLTFRMYTLDQNWQSENPAPVTQRNFLPVVPDMDNHIKNIELLSGGRWLLTLMTRGIALWDLDAAGIQSSMQLIIKFNPTRGSAYQRRFWLNCEQMPRACRIVSTIYSSAYVQLQADTLPQSFG